MNIQQVIESSKTTMGLAAATIGTWLNDFLEVIPDDITKLGAVVAIVVLVMLGRVHNSNAKKNDAETRKLEIEIALLKREEQEKEKKRQIRRNKRTGG